VKLAFGAVLDGIAYLLILNAFEEVEVFVLSFY
jgi:hypothetical protein